MIICSFDSKIPLTEVILSESRIIRILGKHLTSYRVCLHDTRLSGEIFMKIMHMDKIG